MILCLSAFLTLVSAGTEDLIGSWFDQATDDDDVVDVSRFVASKLGYTLVEVERAQIQDLVRYFTMLVSTPNTPLLYSKIGVNRGIH